jgi:hypothetical protein
MNEVRLGAPDRRLVDLLDALADSTVDENVSGQ